MRRVPKRRTKAPPTTGRIGRDAWRAIIAGGALVVLLALIGLTTSGSQSPGRLPHSPQALYDDDELAVGGMVFVPLRGNDCRQKLIDNATWRIRDVGVIDCSIALSGDSGAKQRRWSAARLDIIRNAFRNK
jgi:hypothetical protein